MSEAALRQNAEALYNRKLDEVAAVLGEAKAIDISKTPEPVLYGDVYNNLFGTRSLDDDCHISYARRHGSAFAAEFQHHHDLHNGHENRRNHNYTNLCDRNLVETRQGRVLAGLSTYSLDQEICRRVVGYPMQWGWIGRFVANASWTHGVSCTSCYVLPPREQDENRQYVNDCAADFEDRERRQTIAELEMERRNIEMARLRVEAERHNSRGARLGRMIHGNPLR